MKLSEMGNVAHEELARLPSYWGERMDIDSFVVMPNHVHAIILLVGTPFWASAPDHPTSIKTDTQKRVPTLGQVINGYKGGVSRRIAKVAPDFDAPIWQGHYHDHIIRNEADLNRIREYILYNPARWEEDSLFTRRD